MTTTPTDKDKTKAEAEAKARGEAEAKKPRSVDDHAKRVFPPDAKGRQSREYWKHSAAASLHGWAQHAHHEAKPFVCTPEDYDKALVAAATTNKPHDKALSKHASSKVIAEQKAKAKAEAKAAAEKAEAAKKEES